MIKSGSFEVIKNLEYSSILLRKSLGQRDQHLLQKKQDSIVSNLRVSILGQYEVLGLDQCLMYCFSSPEELQEDPTLLMHKETVRAFEINSIACFIPINDFRERVFNVHQA